jgi:hypothetical protein
MKSTTLIDILECFIYEIRTEWNINTISQWITIKHHIEILLEDLYKMIEEVESEEEFSISGWKYQKEEDF